jgi:hypothetical protein
MIGEGGVGVTLTIVELVAELQLPIAATTLYGPSSKVVILSKIGFWVETLKPLGPFQK